MSKLVKYDVEYDGAVGGYFGGLELDPSWSWAKKHMIAHADVSALYPDVDPDDIVVCVWCESDECDDPNTNFYNSKGKIHTFEHNVEDVPTRDEEEMTSLMFAPGWFQEISTTSEEDEKRDLLIYLSDTHKMLFGFRGDHFSSDDSLEDLRFQAELMQQDVLDEIEREKRLAHEKMLEANKHALATRRAKKALPKTYKPFANLQEII